MASDLCQPSNPPTPVDASLDHGTQAGAGPGTQTTGTMDLTLLAFLTLSVAYRTATEAGKAALGQLSLSSPG